MLSAEEVVSKHEAAKASGLLTPSQRMKIRVLRDIIACLALPKANRQGAEAGLAKWEKTARAYGWPSLAAWESAR